MQQAPSPAVSFQPPTSNPQPDALALAVDLGGTRFRVGLVTSDGRVVQRATHLTQAWDGPEAILTRIARAACDLTAQVSQAKLVGLGIACPGPLDPFRGVVLFAPNMPGWDNVPVRSILEREFQLPTTVGNDANLAALAEGLVGAGRGHRNLVYLTVSTGVGSGVLVDGRLLVGHDGLAAEAGHLVIEPDGPPCGCGGRGCVEALASGTSIARLASELLASGHTGSLLEQVAGDLTAEDVADSAGRGDQLAQDVLRGAARSLGLGIVGLVHVFNPSMVVLGGGVTASGELWWNTVRSTVEARAMRPFRGSLQMVQAALGDDVGLVGAALAVFNPAVALPKT